MGSSFVSKYFSSSLIDVLVSGFSPSSWCCWFLPRVITISLSLILPYLIFRGSESTLMSVELICYVKSIIVFFNKFYYFFWTRLSLMNRLCCNSLFQFVEHDNFWHLNRVVFTHWRHLESRVDAFRYLFSVIKLYTFHYFMKSVPIVENQDSFEIFDTWCDITFADTIF